MKANKLLVGVVAPALLITGLSASFADDSVVDRATNVVKEFRNFERAELTDEQKAQMEEMRTIMDKVKNGEELTEAEQTAYDEFEANRPEGKGGFGDKRGVHKMGGERDGGFMGKGLTDEEKTALESMTDEEKEAFFEEKRAEAEADREARQAENEARETVIDKLLAGETLTSDEETLRAEIIAERAERKAERAEMEANREAMQAIMEKKRNGEELTEEEEATLENMKGGFGGKHTGRGR